MSSIELIIRIYYKELFLTKYATAIIKSYQVLFFFFFSTAPFPFELPGLNAAGVSTRFGGDRDGDGDTVLRTHSIRCFRRGERFGLLGVEGGWGGAGGGARGSVLGGGRGGREADCALRRLRFRTP